MYIDVSLPNFTKQPLTYKYTGNKDILGYRVIIPFGKDHRVGIVVSTAKSTDLNVEIKEITEVLDQYPLIDSQHLIFLKKLSQYYQISLNELVLASIPKESLKKDCNLDLKWYQMDGKTYLWHELLSTHRLPTLQKKIRLGEITESNEVANQVSISPNLSILSKEQQEIYDKIAGISLLWGQTGSGKTEIYIHLIYQALKKKQQVLYLVPEIALTAQAVNKIEKRLGIKATVIHSLLSSKNKLCRFISIRHGKASIILGTRSALLYPIHNLGLIIVDEEHDNSYRQDQGLFFSAKDAAILKASLLNIPIVLGSATPSLESYYNAINGKYQLFTLERYQSILPKITILPRPKDTFISENLIPIVKKELAKNQHVMLYIGKRGYSRLLKCHHCGYELRCDGCDRLLIQHQNNTSLCHYCEKRFPLVTDCQKCKTAELSHYGAGTQRIEELANTLWPNYPTLRIDADQMSSDKASEILTTLSNSKATIIVGTQMLTKGHDIERLNTVIVVDADHQLFAPDFRAEEKMFSELVQVSGRCGRREKQGTVYIQTQMRENKIFSMLNSPKQYYDYLLLKRKEYDLPPYTHIACIFVRAKGKQAKKLLSLPIPNVDQVSILGPDIFPPGKKNGIDCYQIMISTTNRPLRNQVFKRIYHMIKNSLAKNTYLSSQIDSHLSL